MSTKYTKDHEWVTPHGELATIGITKYAAEQLGDVVYIEFPEVGATFEMGKPFGVVESTKTASDVYAPVSGEVVEVNSGLEDDYEVIDQKPDSDGWLIKIRMADPNQLGDLMDEAAYTEYLKGL